MPPGLSIPTSLLASLRARDGWMQWLQWLASTQDGPILVLLGLVVLTCALGVWWRRRS